MSFRVLDVTLSSHGRSTRNGVTARRSALGGVR